MFVLKEKATLEVEEIQQSREVIDLYSEIPDFAGLVFIFDNLNKVIWVWCSEYAKPKGWGKKVKKEKNPQKVAQLVLSNLEEEMQVDLHDYKVAKVIEGNHPDEFEKLFLYDVVDVNLYQKHYYKPEYSYLYDYEQEEESGSGTKKCKNCGWIMSKDKTKCPRCGKNPDVKED